MKLQLPGRQEVTLTDLDFDKGHYGQYCRVLEYAWRQNQIVTKLHKAKPPPCHTSGGWAKGASLPFIRRGPRGWGVADVAARQLAAYLEAMGWDSLPDRPRYEQFSYTGHRKVDKELLRSLAP